MKVKILPTADKGRGVFAAEDISSGTEHISESIFIKGENMPAISEKCPIWLYVFNACNRGDFLLVLDWTSLMNHDNNPNIGYYPTNDNKVLFYALRDIRAGEELTISYGYDVKSHNKRFGYELDNWNDLTINKQIGSVMKLNYDDKSRTFSVSEVKEFGIKYIGYYDHIYPDGKIKEQVMMLSPNPREDVREYFERKLEAKQKADWKANRCGHEYRISRIAYA